MPTAALDRATIRSRGPRCIGCALPPASCICAELPRLRVRTRVVVVVHHVEIRKSTNTTRLLARVVEGVDVRVRGEISGEPRRALPPGRRLVLYPDGAARELGPSDAQGAGAERPVLLVPDGTWKQASRALHRDTDLSGAEIVRLPPGPPSRYGLRRSPRDETVSTFEAVARALGILEGPVIEAALMRPFDRFVGRVRALRGLEDASED